MITGYKWLTQELTAELYLPWEIGVWKDFDSKLAAERCPKDPFKGFNASEKPYDSLENNFGSRWFQIEAEGIVEEKFNSFIATRIILKKELPVKDILLKYCIECAKRCLHVYEKFNSDPAPRNAIEAAESFVNLKTEESIKNATRFATSAAVAVITTASIKTESNHLAALSAASAQHTAELVALKDGSDVPYAAKQAAWQSIQSIAMGLRYEPEGKQRYASEIAWQNSVLDIFIKESLKEEQRS